MKQDYIDTEQEGNYYRPKRPQRDNSKIVVLVILIVIMLIVLYIGGFLNKQTDYALYECINYMS